MKSSGESYNVSPVTCFYFSVAGSAEIQPHYTISILYWNTAVRTELHVCAQQVS